MAATLKKVAVKKATTGKTAAKKVAIKKPAAKQTAIKRVAATKVARKQPAKTSAVKAATKAGARTPGGTSTSQRIDEWIATLGDWRGERLAEIRKLIHEVDPEVVEDWKWKGTPVWSHQGMYVLANPFKGKVKLTFFHGAQLADPMQLFNSGNGGKWRAIDFRESDRIDKTALKALLRAAVVYNTTHSVPRSRGSRA